MITDKAPEGWDDAPVATNTPPPGWDSAPPATPSLRAHPRRGDEISQPDPSPSSPITKEVKPAFDPNGEVRRVQEEIRKGKPGEPLAAAEGRANETRLANDPIANDWIAQELISGAVAGPTVGLAAKGVKHVANTAIDRVASRELESLATGVGKKFRKPIGEVRDAAEQVIKDEPAIFKAKGEKRIEAMEEFLAKENAKNDALYSKYDAKSEVVGRKKLLPLKSNGRLLSEAEAERKFIDRQPTSRPGNFDAIGTDAGGRAEMPTVANKKIPPPPVSPPKPITKLPPPGGTERPTSEYLRARSSRFIEDAPARAEKEAAGLPFGNPVPLAKKAIQREIIPGRGPGVLVGDLVAAREAKIAELSKGTTVDLETAEALKGELEAFKKLYGDDPQRALTGREVRREATALQGKGYRTEATTPAKEAAREASKDLLTVLDKHITDPDDLAKIKASNERISAVTRMLEAEKERISIARTPGNPVKKGPGLIERAKGIPSAVGRGGDRILAQLALASKNGGNVADIVETALKAGITQEAIDATVQNTGRVK